MHQYPLHRPVDAECLCCHTVAQFMFASRSDQVICRGCERHQGTSTRQLTLRNTDHVNLWRSEYRLLESEQAEQRRRAAAALDKANSRIAELTTELDDTRHTLKMDFDSRPASAVAAWLQSLEVQNANDQRDAAYRSRDHALRAVWSIDQLHHDDERKTDYCSCGKPTSACQEWQSLDQIADMLYRWEQHQIDRLKQDKVHGLPRDHPEVQRSGGWRRSG